MQAMSDDIRNKIYAGVLDGKTIAEQIGAQIFMDAFAMMCPNDPERAARYVREAARVSHDGMAVEAAAFLGAMEADAFSVRDMNALIDRNIRFVSHPFLLKVIETVRSICARHSAADWREARREIDERYGYHHFSGPCHIVPNHSMVLASLLLGGDDFHRALTIASSAAWDTDCNAGNTGCLNGIRLGLEALNTHAELREAVADRLLVVTSDGSIWETQPYWFQSWVSSAKQFTADFTHTFCISHTDVNGVATIGTRDWTDYELETTLMFSLHQAGGVVLRSAGHRQYYGVLFSGGTSLSIISRRNDRDEVLASVLFPYTPDTPYRIQARVKDTAITVAVDGKNLLSAESELYGCGGAGFRIDRGTVVARDFIVRGC
jgi:hypothetical protein